MRIEHGGALLWAAALVLVGCCWVAPISAEPSTIGANLAFAATNQNEWASGAPAGGSSSGPQFLGVSVPSIGKIVGGIYTDPVGGQWGAQLGLIADAKVGIDYNINATAGTLNLSYPVKVGFTVPDPSVTQVGALFAITFDTITPTKMTNFLLSGVLSGVAPIVTSLATTGPQIGAFADAYLRAHLFAGAEACVFDCFGPSVDKGIGPRTQELLAINMNSLSTYDPVLLRVLGNNVAGVNTAPTTYGPLTLSAQIPILNSDSRLGGAKGGVSDSGVITANDRSNVFALNLNVDQPQCVKKSCGASQGLLDAREGLLRLGVVRQAQDR